MTNKRLYFSHIPKTAGTFIIKNICEAMKENGLKYYPFISRDFPHKKSFIDYTFFAGHFGTYPVIEDPTVDVACLLRDPLDRMISYFNFLYEPRNKKRYSHLGDYKDQLSFFLFQDPETKDYNNSQSRFLCNPANDNIFGENSLSREQIDNQIDASQPFMWFVDDKKTSIEFSKKQIDLLSISGTVENLNLFTQNVSNWFEKYYGFTIVFELNNKLNTSSIVHNGKSYDTKMCRDLLSKEDVELFIKNNNIDYEIYNYVKTKEVSQ